MNDSDVRDTTPEGAGAGVEPLSAWCGSVPDQPDADPSDFGLEFVNNEDTDSARSPDGDRGDWQRADVVRRGARGDAAVELASSAPDGPELSVADLAWVLGWPGEVSAWVTQREAEATRNRRGNRGTPCPPRSIRRADGPSGSADAPETIRLRNVAAGGPGDARPGDASRRDVLGHASQPRRRAAAGRSIERRCTVMRCSRAALGWRCSTSPLVSSPELTLIAPETLTQLSGCTTSS